MLFVFGLLPCAFYLVVLIGRALSHSRVAPRRAYIAFSYALVPLGLAAWIAFSLAFIFSNFSYVWPALSDPLGWGWNLLGAAGMAWTPYLTRIVPVLQAAVLVGGMAWASATAGRVAREPGIGLSTWPVVAFCLICTLGLLWLLIG